MHDKNETGVIGLVAALIVSLVLLTVSAFVTDFGYAYLNKRTTQNGIDAAVLAAGQNVVKTLPTGKTCQQVANDVNAQTDVTWQTPASPLSTKGVAEKLFRANVVNVKATLADSDIVASCSPTLGLVISAHVITPSDAFFGRSIGVKEVPVFVRAASVVGPIAKVVGLRPIAICQKVAEQAAAHPGQPYAFALEKGDPTCQLSSDTWGAVNFSGSQGTPELRHDIDVGYDQPVSLGPDGTLMVSEGPGLRATLDSNLEGLVGKEIAMPVYDKYFGPPTKEYRVTGFATMQICGFQSGGPSSATVISPCVAQQSSDRYLMFVFKRFVPIASLSDTCTFLDPTCDDGLSYVVKLGQ